MSSAVTAWSVQEKQSQHLSIVTLANMSHIYGDDLLADKLMWDSREERAKEVKALFNISPMVFNHERYYESVRNQIAILAGKAYENLTKAKLMHEQTAFRHIYNLYLEGKRSEADLKQYAEEAIKITTALMEEDRAAYIA